MRGHSQRFAALLLTPIAALAFAGASHALTIQGVEFTDFDVFDLQPGADLALSTAGDIYIHAPVGLFAAQIDLYAEVAIFVDVPFEATGDASLCTIPIEGVCVRTPPTSSRDVVVRILGPVGALDLDAAGSIVIAAVPIPEPSTLTLLSLGLLALSRARRRVPQTTRARFGKFGITTPASSSRQRTTWRL